ncbi:hypothetical protein J4414_00615 [Candidatus Woesearchaeota archaeon]|nr:hypothetical protein [Candidatus Woesearchaeota archaeon]
MEYDLELEKAVNKIKEEKARRVLVQLPDGLKNKALEVVDYLEKNTDADIFIWLESNWGNCDFPDVKEVDLLIQWGHSDPKDLHPVPGGLIGNRR